MRAIMTRFSPYQGDDIEHQEERSREIPCPDCDFKFRDQYVTPHPWRFKRVSVGTDQGAGRNLRHTFYRCTAVEAISSNTV